MEHTDPTGSAPQDDAADSPFQNVDFIRGPLDAQPEEDASSQKLAEEDSWLLSRQMKEVEDVQDPSSDSFLNDDLSDDAFVAAVTAQAADVFAAEDTVTSSVLDDITAAQAGHPIEEEPDVVVESDVSIAEVSIVDNTENIVEEPDEDMAAFLHIEEEPNVVVESDVSIDEVSIVDNTENIVEEPDEDMAAFLHIEEEPNVVVESDVSIDEVSIEEEPDVVVESDVSIDEVSIEEEPDTVAESDVSIDEVSIEEKPAVVAEGLDEDMAELLLAGEDFVASDLIPEMPTLRDDEVVLLTVGIPESLPLHDSDVVLGEIAFIDMVATRSNRKQLQRQVWFLAALLVLLALLLMLVFTGVISTG